LLITHSKQNENWFHVDTLGPVLDTKMRNVFVSLGTHRKLLSNGAKHLSLSSTVWVNQRNAYTASVMQTF
jgi:hypothetical protein